MLTAPIEGLDCMGSAVHVRVIQNSAVRNGKMGHVQCKVWESVRNMFEHVGLHEHVQQNILLSTFTAKKTPV